MASKERQGRKSIKNKFKMDRKQAELFLYGKLRYKARAVGYCDLHKCYLDSANLSEKRCHLKKCKHFCEVK